MQHLLAGPAGLRSALLGGLAMVTVGISPALSQQTSNPYKDKYRTDFHWTDSLNWTNVVNVTTLGAIANDNQSDQAAIEAAITQAAADPRGGVVWFPAGSYNLTEDLHIKSGVVLRGETPTVTDAKDAAFNPPSKLEFPQYILGDTSLGGNPVSTAFKEIVNDEGGTSNIGFVWLDINRAGIHVHPNYDSLGRSISAGGNNANWQPREFNRNCLVFGVRNNNVAIPQSDIPSGQQRPYQRFSWRFSSNLDLNVGANCTVANNRINDAVTDDFNVDNYRATNNRLLPINGGTYVFSYTDHYGITLNRSKIRRVNGIQKIEPYFWYPSPREEPSLFRKGMEVRDNWVFRTMRVAIIASGQGLVIDGNIIKDRSNKSVALTPSGLGILTNYSATFENRGIDFSGWDVTITRNDVEVRNHSFPPSQYNSIDGEGIMNQGNSGGTQVDGIIAKHNIVNSNVDRGTNPGFSCYKTGNINNVLVDSNEFTGSNGLIMIVADQNGRNAELSNVQITNNINAKNIEALGTLGGTNCLIDNNTNSRAGSTIEASCHVVLGPNNVTYSTITGCTGTRAPDLAYPQGYLDGPMRDTAVALDLLTPTITFKGQVTSTTAIDTVNYWLDTRYLGSNLVSAANDFSYNLNTAGLGIGTYSFKARLYAGGSWSSTQLIRLRVLPPTVSLSKGINVPVLAIHPNPTSHKLMINKGDQASQIIITDLVGRVALSTQQTNQLDVSGLQPGLYHIRATIGGKVHQARFVRE